VTQRRVSPFVRLLYRFCKINSSADGTNDMPQRLRKFIGAILLVTLIIIYALVATAIATARLADASGWVHLAYFLFTGILWVLPAMAIVSWMLKPDRKSGRH
jgi:hypothetical protein